MNSCSTLPEKSWQLGRTKIPTSADQFHLQKAAKRKIARKTQGNTSSKKNLEGLYEAFAVGSLNVKTLNTTSQMIKTCQQGNYMSLFEIPISLKFEPAKNGRHP